MTKKITKEQIEEMVMASLKEAIEKNPELINEGWFRDLGRGIASTASQIGNFAGGAYNTIRANNKQRQANGVAGDIQAQIQKSQQIINRENQKIKELYKKQDALNAQAKQYAQKANQNAANLNLNPKMDMSKFDYQNNFDKYNKNTWSTDQQFANRQKRQQRKQQQQGLVAEAIEKAWKKYAALG